MEIFGDMIIAMLNIMGWAYSPFLAKILLKQISPFSFTILRVFLSIPLGIVGSFYTKNELFNKSANFYLLTFIFVLILFITQFMNASLLKKYNANIVTAIVNPLIIFMSAVIGNLFYKEPFTRQMWIGLLFILIGLIIFILGRKNIERG